MNVWRWITVLALGLGIGAGLTGPVSAGFFGDDEPKQDAQAPAESDDDEDDSADCSTLAKWFGGIGRHVGLSDRTCVLDDKPLLEYLADETFEADIRDSAAVQQGFVKDTIRLRRMDSTVAHIDALEAYANGVLDKVLAGWPYPHRPIKVKLSVSPDFGTDLASEHGTIFLSLTTLNELGSEDELAGLLGHEASHLLLGHAEKDVIDKIAGKIHDYADTYNRIRAPENGAEDAARRLFKLRISRWMLQNALFPNWNRGQENEADALGVDLMMRAGYNPDAMREFLKRMEKRASLRAEVIANSPVFTQDNGQWKFDLSGLLDNVLSNLGKEFNKNHEDAQARREKLRNYVSTYYPDRPRTELDAAPLRAVLAKPGVKAVLARYQDAFDAEDATLVEASEKQTNWLGKAAQLGLAAISGETRADPYTRLVMFRIRDAQAKPDSARKNLEVAHNSGEAPWGVYLGLADLNEDRKDYAKALVYLNEMLEIFDADALLPRMIGLNKRLGIKVPELAARCLATGKASLIQECNQS